MKCGILTSPGVGLLCQTEITELLNKQGNPITDGMIVDLTWQEIQVLLLHSQSLRRLIILLGRGETPEQCTISTSLRDYFTPECSLVVEVDNIKGQDNRQRIAKSISEILFKQLERESIAAHLDYKKPQVRVVVYWTGDEYLVGVDVCGRELHQRDYRVFPHSSSLKGDLAYWLVRQSGYHPGEKLLVGFAKDGVIPIEAALWLTRTPLRDLAECSFHHFPSYQKQEAVPVVGVSEGQIFAFDSTLPNVLASRKNAAIARVKKSIDFQRHSLEDLDAHYDEQSFDRLIFMVTSKDEESINELYYQSGLLLKQGGSLLILAREQWDMPISEKFDLISCEKLLRGDGFSKVWLLRKK